MDTLETSIIDFVADESGIRRDKVLLTSRLSKDLGIEGLDAEELFEAFGKKFNVDLTVLWDYWDFHFSPEGGPGWTIAIPLLVCFLIGEAIHRALGWFPFWAYGVALFVLWIWPLRCWPLAGEAPLQITVQELVEAARQGRWIRAYHSFKA